MKIAMIGHKRIPSREGGVERVVEELSTHLVKKGNQVTVYNRRGKNVQDKNANSENQKLKEYYGVKIVTIPTINKKGIDALLYSFFATIRALFGRYDVIHYHAEGPCAMLWLPHLLGIKTVATIHGLDWQRSKWGGLASKYIKFGEKIAAKYADEIIVLSEGVQKYFKDTYDRDTHFIANGVNKPVLKEADVIKQKWGLEKDDYILFLARIVPEKGLHYLIEAYKQIDTNKKLVIAGGASHTNDYFKKIQAMAKEDERIILTGFVQGQELEELFSNCYLYCLPSDIEGMPISLLEAMSYGCFCLVSDIEENTQITQDYALTFEKGNVKNLKEKLEIALHDVAGARKKEQIQYILYQYDWEKATCQTEEIYLKENKSKKNKWLCMLLFLITAVIILLNSIIIDNQIVKLVNYAYAYSLITFLFLLKYNPKLKLDLSLLMVGFYTIMIGCSPIVSAISIGQYSGIYYDEQYLFILLSYIAMLLGYGITFVGHTNSKKRIVTKSYDKNMKVIGFLLVIFSCIGCLMYLFKNQFMLFRGNLEDDRITAMSGNGIILQMISLSILGGGILFKQYTKKNLKVITIVIISIITIAVNLSIGFRSSILTYALFLLLIYNKEKPFNIKKLLILIVPLFIIIILFGVLRGGALSGKQINVSFIRSSLSALRVGSNNLSWIMNRFPSYVKFQHGYTYLINIIMLRPGPDIEFTLWLKKALGVSFAGGGVTPTIIGEFYLNFGYLGTYIGMLAFGMLLHVLQNKYQADNNIVLYSFIIAKITGAFSGGIANVMIGIGIGTVVLLGCELLEKIYERIRE